MQVINAHGFSVIGLQNIRLISSASACLQIEHRAVKFYRPIKDVASWGIAGIDPASPYHVVTTVDGEGGRIIVTGHRGTTPS